MYYWTLHRPADCRAFPDFRADQIKSSKIWPADFLEKPEMYFCDTQHYNCHDVLNTLKAIQGNPEMLVRIYRGAPSNGQLNTGDWVTLSRSYANEYAGRGMHCDNKSAKVYSYLVAAKHLSFDGDSIFEFGYWGDTINAAEAAA